MLSADGTVRTLFNAQTLAGTAWSTTSGANFAISTVTDPAVATHFYLDDHLATAQLELSSQGYPVWRGQFAPFGAELDTLPTANHYKFTGKERDTESGLDYFGARYYASGMGRWISPDWAAKPEDVPYSDLVDPQSLNLYGYVRNNPLTRVDADGHNGWDFFAGLVNATVTNSTAGIGRRTGNSDYSLGQKVGDAVSIVGGAIEMAGGTTIASGGVAACATGVGCPAGALAIAAGSAIAVHGASEVSTAAGNLFRTGSGPSGNSGRPHGNTAGDQPANLYEKYDKNGKFEKHGVSQKASERYTKAEVDGGEVRVTDRGPRREMLAKERYNVETNPGPKNKERWAGKQKK